MEILEFIQQPTYVKIRVAPADIPELRKWMLQTECGKQVSMSHFAFRSEAEYAMFLLRFAPTGKLTDTRTHKEESSF
jgi:hypothetical protein